MTDKYTLRGEPRDAGTSHLMIECPDPGCRWVMFVKYNLRGQKYVCERCGKAALVPNRETEAQEKKEEIQNGQEKRNDHE